VRGAGPSALKRTLRLVIADARQKGNAYCNEPRLRRHDVPRYEGTSPSSRLHSVEAVAQTEAVVRNQQRRFSTTSQELLSRAKRVLRDRNDSV
jgi:hypothetical protein